MKKFSKFASVLLLLFLLVAPLIVSAQLVPPNTTGTNLRDLSRGQGIAGFATFIIQTVLFFAGLVAVLFLIIGGYQYIVSGVNEEMAEQGKKTVQNAIIGIVIIIVSFTIVTVIFRALAGIGN